MKRKSFAFLILGISLFGAPFIVQAKFADIDTTHPNYHAINFLETNDVVQGYLQDGNKFFKSLQKVSRAEAVKMVMLSAQEKEGYKFAGGGTDFPDVPAKQWFAPYVATAVENSIVGGFADGSFHPAAQVSRAELLKMAALAFKAPVKEIEPAAPEVTSEEDSEQPLADKEGAPQTDWFAPFIDFAKKMRIISSDNDDPYESLGRGEVAEIIFRIYKVAESGFTKPYTYSGDGFASYYGEGFQGKTTASGEIFDLNDMTAAHRTLPFGTRLRVWNDEGTASIVVRVNDRGPYHTDRIMDLSEKAFAKLGNLSRGVIHINFEVFDAPDDEGTAIPEYIRPNLTEESKSTPVPETVQKKILNDRGQAGGFDPSLLPLGSIFDGTMKSAAPSFFETATLRHPLPQKILLGTVMNFSGIAKESGHEKATVFLEKIQDSNLPKKPQTLFSGEVSDKDFAFPVMFLETGKFKMGFVFDDQTRSRVIEIEVVAKQDRTPAFTNKKIELGDFDIRMVPEKLQVHFSWPWGQTRLTRVVFFQGTTQKLELLVEGGIDHLDVPYSFFSRFEIGKPLGIDVFQAESQDATVPTRTMNWQKLGTETFDLVPGFPDSETPKISIKDFPRFSRELNPVTLNGKVLGAGIKLPENAYLTLPSGMVNVVPIKNLGYDQFSVQVKPDKWGTYVIEFVSTEGEVLFNRAMYFSSNMVLPVGKWSEVPFEGETVATVRAWINRIRGNLGSSSLFQDANLDKFAQQYADKMASENFISHTSPTGMTFKQRLDWSGLRGEFSENLGFGSDFRYALLGLSNSGSHRKNILDKKWKYMGVGLSVNKQGVYIVQEFSKEKTSVK